MAEWSHSAYYTWLSAAMANWRLAKMHGARQSEHTAGTLASKRLSRRLRDLTWCNSVSLRGYKKVVQPTALIALIAPIALIALVAHVSHHIFTVIFTPEFAHS